MTSQLIFDRPSPPSPLTTVDLYKLAPKWLTFPVVLEEQPEQQIVEVEVGVWMIVVRCAVSHPEEAQRIS